MCQLTGNSIWLMGMSWAERGICGHIWKEKQRAMLYSDVFAARKRS